MCVSFCACRKDEVVVYSTSGFPGQISSIVEHTCASTGCHTTSSKIAAAGLSMSTWAELMEGGNNGNAAVIPFSAEHSPFFFVINHFNELGPVLEPQMPYERPAFTKERILEFAAWINAGAPNSVGEFAFDPLPERELIYVLNAQCNLVTVIDATTGLAIRYVDVSAGGGGFAEIIETSADGQYFYVCHNSGELKKFEVATNKKVGQLDLGSGYWRSMVISENSQKALISDWSGNSDLHGGKIALVDLSTLSLISMYDNPSDSIYFPNGITANANFDVAYVSCQTGNFIYKIDFSDEINPLVSRVKLIDSDDYIFTSVPYRPSEIVLSNDQLRYYVIGEISKKLYVFDAADDAVIATLDLGTTAQKCVISESQNILAVSNMEDVSTMPSGKGFIRLFDLTSLEILADIYSGYQPRAMTITEDGKTLYIFNRNADLTGADQPHHYGGCEGNNGYATRIDLATLQLDPMYKAELNVNPFSAAARY